MVVSEALVDSAVKAALGELKKKAGVSFDSDEHAILTEKMSDFLVDDCEIDILTMFAFGDLKEDQWMSWLELAREAQESRGEETETISSEDTEREAEHLFALHNGELPQEDVKPVNQVALISVTQNGSDEAVLLNGKTVLTADPTCGDSLETVSEVALQLAFIHEVEVVRLEVAPEANWCWDGVIRKLKSQAKLVA